MRGRPIGYRKRLSPDELELDNLLAERKTLTALWYSKMAGQTPWIDEGERDNFEREFARLERAIRAQEFAMMPFD